MLERKCTGIEKDEQYAHVHSISALALEQNRNSMRQWKRNTSAVAEILIRQVADSFSHGLFRHEPLTQPRTYSNPTSALSQVNAKNVLCKKSNTYTEIALRKLADGTKSIQM
jgi:hypothetical protein